MSKQRSLIQPAAEYSEEVNMKHDDYKQSMDELRELERKLEKLRVSRADLSRNIETAEEDIVKAGQSLDSAIEEAAITGNQKIIKQVRDTITTAKQARAQAEDELAAIDRVIDRTTVEIGAVAREAQMAHRAYWLSVEQHEIEQCKAAAVQILRAYKAHRAANLRDSLEMRDYFHGMGMGGGLFEKIGLVEYALSNVDLGVDVPDFPPFNRYA